MAAYGNIDQAFPGLLFGLNARRQIETWRATEEMGFGIPVFGYVGDALNMYPAKQDIGIITLDADFVLDNVITTTLTIDGVAQTPVATTWDTDHDTTMDNHKDDLEAAFTGLEVTLTDATDNREFTLFLKGKNIQVASVITLGASQANITITYNNNQIFLGVTSFTQKGSIDTVGVNEENDPSNVLTHGKLWVEPDTTVQANTDAYVIWQIGADQGKFTATATNNYATGCKFRENTTSQGYSVVEVNGQNIDATP